MSDKATTGMLAMMKDRSIFEIEKKGDVFEIMEGCDGYFIEQLTAEQVAGLGTELIALAGPSEEQVAGQEEVRRLMIENARLRLAALDVIERRSGIMLPLEFANDDEEIRVNPGALLRLKHAVIGPQGLPAGMSFNEFSKKLRGAVPEEAAPDDPASDAREPERCEANPPAVKIQDSNTLVHGIEQHTFPVQLDHRLEFISNRELRIALMLRRWLSAQTPDGKHVITEEELASLCREFPVKP